MKCLRNITSILLVVLLVFMTGLSSASHALSMGCVGGHCDEHKVMPVVENHTGHALGELTSSTLLGSDGIEHDECNPFLCNSLTLILLTSDAVFDQSEAVLGWQVGHLSTLEEPDNPDRPPNL